MPSKFGVYFEEEAVPEWRNKYVNYGKLKRSLKDLESTLLQPEPPPLPRPVVSLPTGTDFETDGARPAPGTLFGVPEELEVQLEPLGSSGTEFGSPESGRWKAPYASLIALMDKQLDKVDTFYQEREREAVERWNQMVAQLRLIEELEARMRGAAAQALGTEKVNEANGDSLPFSSGGGNGFRIPGIAPLPLGTLSRNPTALPNQPFSVPATIVRRGGGVSDLPQTPRVSSRPDWERLFTGMGSFLARSPPSNSSLTPVGSGPIGPATTAAGKSNAKGKSDNAPSPKAADGTPLPLMPTTPLMLGPAASPLQPLTTMSPAGQPESQSTTTTASASARPMAPSALLRHRLVAASTTSLQSASAAQAESRMLNDGQTQSPAPLPTPLQISVLTPSNTQASVKSLAGSVRQHSPGMGSFSVPHTPQLLIAPVGHIRSLADARRNLKKVVMEFYRYLTLVRNFQSLNRGALERVARRMDEILKVAAKSASVKLKKDWRNKANGGKTGSPLSFETTPDEEMAKIEYGVGKRWFQDRVLTAQFCASTMIPKLVVGTEELYIQLCTARPFSAAGDRVVPPSERRRLLHQLRLPEHSLAAAPAVRFGGYGPTYRSGFLFGLMLPPFVASVYVCIKVAVTSAVFPDELRIMLQIHGGFLIPLLLLFLFAVNTLAYSRVQINYPFIFEFDPRDYLTPYQLMELALLATTLVCFSLYLSVGFNFLPFIPSYWYPAILAIILVIMAFWPFDQLQRSARWWMLRTLARILVFNIGVGRVEFRDFFITDELTSITYTFTSVQAFFCAYIAHWENLGDTCPLGATYWIALPTSFPSLWRLSQCLLRWRETANAWPHGANALKYILSLSVIWFASWSKISGLVAARVLWIVAATCSACYSYFWDVYYDWGLWRIRTFGEKHFLLRKELRYAPIAVYYIAMVLNAFLRINWIFLISPSYWGILIDGRILALLFAVLEVYRRFQWNFFRMENEHLNNCGMYRAVLDIPLPFQILEPPTDEKKEAREERKRIIAERAAERADKLRREATISGALKREGTGLSLRREPTVASQSAGVGKKVTATPELEAGMRVNPPSAGALKSRDTAASLEYTPRLVPEGLAMLAEDDDLDIDEELELDDDEELERKVDPADEDSD